MVGVMGALLLLSVCFYHYSRNVRVGMPSTDAMDMVQVGRRVARGNGLSTNIVRPLVLRYVRPNPDGSVPDTAHAPLYPILAGMTMKMRGQDGPGEGDRMAALLSLIFFVTSLFACYLLARRLFGTSGAFLSCLLYALGANALSIAIEPGPVTLATTLFTLLLAALVGLDPVTAGASGDIRSGGGGRLGRAVLAGALFGVLFLTIYSALILLIPILVYVYRVTRRSYGAVAAFLVAALLIASPLLLRNMRVTEAHNPFFNARLLELIMQTETFPGYALYRTLGTPQTLGEYLASGGTGELLRKLSTNVLGYYVNAPYSFGILVLPLFLVAALTRFTNPQVNRIRFLVYVLLGLHVLALSLFLPFRDGLPLLLIYLPFATIIGTTFFLNFIRARNLPPFYARAMISAWILFACIPGIVQLFPTHLRTSNVYQVFPFLLQNASGDSHASAALFASDLPWEVAFRTGMPALWLPNDSSEFRAAESRLGRQVTGIVLTPALLGAYGSDPSITAWRSMYMRLGSLLLTASYLDATAQRQLLSTSLRYPSEIGEVLVNYEPPQPIPELQGSTYSLYWKARPRSQARAAGRGDS
jgi:4-amino-4-deoxy-L-arabinose transferase-like glycosyltransferase